MRNYAESSDARDEFRCLAAIIMFGWFLVTFGFLTTLSSALLHSGKPCNFNQTDNLHRRLTYLGVVFGCVLRTGPFSIFILKFYVPFCRFVIFLTNKEVYKDCIESDNKSEI